MGTPEYRAKHVEYTTKYRNSTKGKKYMATYLKEYSKREYVKVSNALRSHNRRIKIGKGTLSLAEWELLVKAWGYSCAYCEESNPLTIEHVIPISKGGEHTLDNVVPACLKCNLRKNKMLVGTYLVRIGKSPQSWLAKQQEIVRGIRDILSRKKVA